MMGFSIALSLENLLFAFIGCILGTLIGLLPGLGPAAGTAILIPDHLQAQSHLCHHHAVRHLLRGHVRGDDHFRPDQCPRGGSERGYLPRRLCHGQAGKGRPGAGNRSDWVLRREERWPPSASFWWPSPWPVLRLNLALRNTSLFSAWASPWSWALPGNPSSGP